jgi:hypothetical protein
MSDILASRRSIVATAAILPFAAMAGLTAAGAAQPNMEAALRSLREARASLEKASADKAGHRVKAIDLVSQAIEQVRLGIEAGES